MPVFTWANGDSLSSVRTKIINKLSPVIDVKADFSATGNGSTDDTANIQAALDAAFKTAGSPNAEANVFNNRAVYFPPGWYKITSPLTLTDVIGAHVFGAGRFTTKIENTAGGSVFVSNGLSYSVFERMHLNTSGSGICFDADWDGSGPVSLQSVSFNDMMFNNGAVGLRAGHSGNMGSEFQFSNCYFIAQSLAGLQTENANALMHTVLGGNFAQCATGILVSGGSVPNIIGTSFQNNAGIDLDVVNSAADTYFLSGCRSESQNFAYFRNGASGVLTSCNQVSATAGNFAYIEGTTAASAGSGTLLIEGGWSQNGIIFGGANSTLYIRGNPAIRRPIAISNIADNGSGKMRLTVSSTAAWSSGQNRWLSGIAGTGAVLALNNTNAVGTVVNPTTLDLLAVNFGGTYTSGGVVDGHMFGNPAYLGSFSGVVAQNI